MHSTLIAGGTGFIGQRLAEMLATLEHDITVIGKNKRQFPRLEKIDTKIFFGDLSRNALFDIVPKSHFDYVINLTGYINHNDIEKNGWETFEAHTKSTLNLIKDIEHKTLRTFIQIGTSDEYGNNPAPQNEMSREQCISPYSLAKLTATHLVQMQHEKNGFPGVVIRPFLVFGPGQSRERLIPFLIEQSLQDRHFDTSKGEQLRDFLFIDDFCEGLISLFDQENAYGKIFNIASGKGVPVNKVVKTILNLVGGGKANFGARPYRKGENMALYADIEQIKMTTGWSPKTSLMVGLQKTIDELKHLHSS